MGMMLTQLARSRMRNYPENVFRGGAVGAWFDPSDFSTMFQDAAGTQPVTSFGQPVALILDKSQRLELGAELFSNQAITSINNSAGSATYATDNAARTLTVTVAGISSNYPRMFVDLGLTVGKTYLISGRIDGDRSKLSSPPIRLATINQLNNLSYNSTTGKFSGRVEAATTGIEVLYDGTKTGSITLATISCKELKGNHARQASATTSRPTIQARVNRATNTGFSLGGVGSVPTGWIERGLVTGRVVASDSASGYAMRVTGGGVSAGIASTDDVRLSVTGWAVAGVSTTLKFKIRKAPGSGAGQAAFVWASGPTQAVSITDNWTEVSYTRDTSSTSHSLFFGSVVAGVVYDITDLSVVVSTDTSFPYHRVNTDSDYTDIGAPRYLAFDGTDDWLETAAIDMTSTDSVTLVAGLRKNSDSAQGFAVEFSPTLVSTNGSFHIAAPVGATPSYAFRSRGTAVAQADANSGYAAPLTSVLTGIGDISSDTAILRVNGAQAVSVSWDQGTGNYGNHKLYLGRRGGASSPFNGRLYGLVIVGASQSDAIVSTLEKHMARKTGVTF